MQAFLADLFADHGPTIVISTVVVTVLSFVMAVLSKRDIKTNEKKPTGPQPKWGVLQAMNYIVLAVFVSSVTYVCSNYRKMGGVEAMEETGYGASPISNVFLPYVVLWCLCLAYFFGFFGISLIDTDAMASSPSSYDLAGENSTQDAPRNNLERKKQPRNDTPICSEIEISRKIDMGIAAGGAVQIEQAEIKQALKKAYLPSTSVKAGGGEEDFVSLTDDQILSQLLSGSVKDYQLEKKLGDYERAVGVRRMLYEEILDQKFDKIPYMNYDYNKVFGANCEIVVGYVPIPLGIVGPILINEEPTYIPMATTEGCLVASTNRGCKAISSSGGCTAILLKDAITRAPCIRMPSALRAAALKRWVEVAENYKVIEEAFNSTTSYGKLESLTATIAGRNVYLRFCCMSGDAMGMNMVSKGCLKAIEVLEGIFPDLILVAISGNMCTDKKPAAINWILGRGKSVVVEAVIPEKIVHGVLKTTVAAMVETNKQKNLVGSAMAGSIGGFNAHASNIVTAVFLATGQDPAQNVESSSCLTMMDFADDGTSLHVSVTMPSIEVGTVGGGTHLPAQAGCLDICGVRGASKPPLSPGDNARQLALIVGSAVLAGELSLMAALAANHLVRSHMQHNRKPTSEEPVTSPVSTVSPDNALNRKHASMPDLTNVEKP